MSIKFIQRNGLKQNYSKSSVIVFFSEVNGKSNVVCFCNMANTIINDKLCEDKNCNIDDETKRIVTTAAKLIDG